MQLFWLMNDREMGLLITDTLELGLSARIMTKTEMEDGVPIDVTGQFELFDDVLRNVWGHFGDDEQENQ